MCRCAKTRGRLWLEALGVWLEVKEDYAICYDGVTDQPLGDCSAIAAELEKVNAENEMIKVERDQAEAKNRELEAKLAKWEASAK